MARPGSVSYRRTTCMISGEKRSRNSAHAESALSAERRVSNPPIGSSIICAEQTRGGFCRIRRIGMLLFFLFSLSGSSQTATDPTACMKRALAAFVFTGPRNTIRQRPCSPRNDLCCAATIQAPALSTNYVLRSPREERHHQARRENRRVGPRLCRQAQHQCLPHRRRHAGRQDEVGAAIRGGETPVPGPGARPVAKSRRHLSLTRRVV